MASEDNVSVVVYAIGLEGLYLSYLSSGFSLALVAGLFFGVQFIFVEYLKLCEDYAHTCHGRPSSTGYTVCQSSVGTQVQSGHMVVSCVVATLIQISGFLPQQIVSIKSMSVNSPCVCSHNVLYPFLPLQILTTCSAISAGS